MACVDAAAVEEAQWLGRIDLSDVKAHVTSSDRVVAIIESGIRAINTYQIPSCYVPEAVVQERARNIATVLICEELVKL